MAVVAGLLLAGAVAPSAALAHQTTPGLALRFERVDPAIEGLDVEARDDPAPTLVVRNGTGKPFEVLGRDGVPFLRIGPGRVSANLASPDWWDSETLVPGGAPSTAAPGATPRWVPIRDGAEWAWYEHRLAGAAGAAGRPWTIPARAGGRDVALEGTWEAIVVYGAFHSRVESVTPGIEGVEVTILPGAVPGLFVRNDTAEVLEIPGPGGRPFLRISRAGGAELADPTGAYQPAGATPRYGWVEPRAGWTGGEIPERLRTATAAVRVGAWSIPMRLGERDLTVEGTLEWVPVRAHHEAAPERGSRFWLTLLLVAGSAAILAAAVLVRRRRSRVS